MLFYAVSEIRALVGDIADEAEYAIKVAQLPVAMRAYAEHGSSLRSRVDRLAALQLLCRLLAEHGLSTDRKILRQANGRPYFEDGTVDFNLSHSDGFVAAVIGDGRVGIDLQAANLSFDPLPLATRFFSAEEAAAVASDEDPTDRFFRLWTQKEAVGKAMGGGLGNTLRQLPQNAAALSTEVLMLGGKPFYLSVCRLTE